MANIEEFNNKASYDTKPLIGKNIGFDLGYNLNNKLTVGTSLNYQTKGYSGWNIIIREQELPFPRHAFYKRKFHYLGVGLNLEYRIFSNIKLKLAIKSMFLQESTWDYNFFRQEYKVDNMNYGPSLTSSSNAIYQAENFDSVLEFGFSHYIFKNISIEAIYSRGFFPVFTDPFELSIYNQALSFSILYDFHFNIKNKTK